MAARLATLAATTINRVIVFGGMSFPSVKLHRAPGRTRLRRRLDEQDDASAAPVRTQMLPEVDNLADKHLARRCAQLLDASLAYCRHRLDAAQRVGPRPRLQ